MASNDFTNSKLWDCFSIRAYNNDCYDVYFPFKNKMEYHRNVHACWTSRMGLWRLRRSRNRMVGHGSLFTQYIEYSSTHTFCNTGRKLTFCLGSNLLYYTRYHTE